MLLKRNTCSFLTKPFPLCFFFFIFEQAKLLFCHNLKDMDYLHMRINNKLNESNHYLDYDRRLSALFVHLSF